MDVKTIKHGMTLLPVQKGLCPECGGKHDPALPHENSLYYGVKFQMEHGRSPTRRDAMTHCSRGMQVCWLTETIRAATEVFAQSKDEKTRQAWQVELRGYGLDIEECKRISALGRDAVEVFVETFLYPIEGVV